MRALAPLRAAAAALLMAAPALAQMTPAVRDSVAPDTAIAVPEYRPRRTHDYGIGGGSLFYVAPRGEFGEHVGGGVGYSLAGALHGDTAGVFALRAEWQDVTYGFERSNDSTVRNVIRTLDVGPQVTLPLGAVRPYVSAALGLAYLGTPGSKPCRRGCSYDEDGDPQDDTFTVNPRMTWSVGRAVGVLFRGAKETARRPAMWLDVRVSFRRNGETRYGVGGTRETVRGRTEYRTLHLGISTGLR